MTIRAQQNPLQQLTSQLPRKSGLDKYTNTDYPKSLSVRIPSQVSRTRSCLIGALYK